MANVTANPTPGRIGPRSRLRRTMTLGLSCLLLSSIAAAQTTVIEDVRVFTGDEVLESATVLIEDGKIARVETSPFEAPEGATVVNPDGDATLLPGLIDGHVHAFGESTLQDALNFGVTTELDMFTQHGFAANMRRQQAAGPVPNRADLFSASTLVTAKGGHGTQFGVPIPTLDDAANAEKFVEDRIAEGSDYIKLVYEDGSTIERPLNTLTRESLGAAIEAAQARDKLAVVHVSTAEKGLEAFELGADGLVHVWWDKPESDAVYEKAKETGAFVTPTLAILTSVVGNAHAAELVEDGRLASYLSPGQRGNLGASYGREPDPQAWGVILESVRRLHEAGVPILAGSDTPNPGTAHGVSMHLELELLTDAGLSNLEALRAATANPADAYDLDDRGRIAAGKKADVFLVAGNPLEDIEATRDIVGIWKDGVAFERPTFQVGESDHPVIESGLFADFEGGKVSAAAGSFFYSTDQMMGGKSEGGMSVTSPGARGSQHAMRIEGEIKEGSPFPWSGPMFSPGATMMAASNVKANAVTFDVRGDGRTFRLLGFAESIGQMPAEVTFDTSGEWQKVTVPLDSLPGLDKAGLMALLWSAGRGQGTFWLEIDNIAFE